MWSERKESSGGDRRRAPGSAGCPQGAGDRVRARGSEKVNSKIEEQIATNVRTHGSSPEQNLTERIDSLDHEWDVDRATMAAFAVAGGTALTLGLKNRNWFFLLGAQLFFIAYHAAFGWCPPVAALRRLGFRTHKEIDAERYALKTLRGDFKTRH